MSSSPLESLRRSIRREQPAARFGDVLARSLGDAIWRIADPESLPVPPPGGVANPDAEVSPHPLRLPVRLTSMVLLGIALACLVVGVSATVATRGAVESFRRAPLGTPITELAAGLEYAFKDSWWRVFYPSLQGKTEEAARTVRDGQRSLLNLVKVYEQSGTEFNKLGPPGRVLQGARLVRPLDQALSKIIIPWHRGTLAFQELDRAVRPYLEAERSPVARVSGQLRESPGGRALVIAILDSDGSVLNSSPRLTPGDAFDLPLKASTRVRFSNILRSTREITESVEFAIESWPEQDVTFPASGQRFGVRFSPDFLRKAPKLQPLSPSARRELGLPPAPESR